jgi:hypothetical protein
LRALLAALACAAAVLAASPQPALAGAGTPGTAVADTIRPGDRRLDAGALLHQRGALQLWEVSGGRGSMSAAVAVEVVRERSLYGDVVVFKVAESRHALPVGRGEVRLFEDDLSYIGESWQRPGDTLEVTARPDSVFARIARQGMAVREVATAAPGGAFPASAFPWLVTALPLGGGRSFVLPVVDMEDEGVRRWVTVRVVGEYALETRDVTLPCWWIATDLPGPGGGTYEMLVDRVGERVVRTTRRDPSLDLERWGIWIPGSEKKPRRAREPYVYQSRFADYVPE